MLKNRVHVLVHVAPDALAAEDFYRHVFVGEQMIDLQNPQQSVRVRSQREHSKESN